jgi:hypothetical protein
MHRGGIDMSTIEIQLRRFSIVSARPFHEVVNRVTATIGRPDLNAFHKEIAAARTAGEMEEVVHAATGPSGLMEYIRFDAGDVVRQEHGGQSPRILRLVVGNRLTLREMLKTVPDVASYAPLSILIDERTDGVHLSYDSIASLVAPYGSEAALRVARNLDAKIESLLAAAANSELVGTANLIEECAQ